MEVGSIPNRGTNFNADIVQVAEHYFGKVKVVTSIVTVGSIFNAGIVKRIITIGFYPLIPSSNLGICAI